MTTEVGTTGRDAVLVEDAARIQIMGFPVLEALPSRRAPYQRVDRGAMTMAVCLHLHQLTLAFVAVTGGMDMRLISAQALKEKLDHGDPLKLVNALGEWEYRAAHIPGSLHFATPEETLSGLGRDDEIVVHCSNPSCMASVALYQLLERNGYRNLRRFAGGLQEWQEAGYPLEGDMVDLQGDGPRT